MVKKSLGRLEGILVDRNASLCKRSLILCVGAFLLPVLLLLGALSDFLLWFRRVAEDLVDWLWDNGQDVWLALLAFSFFWAAPLLILAYDRRHAGEPAVHPAVWPAVAAAASCVGVLAFLYGLLAPLPAWAGVYCAAGAAACLTLMAYWCLVLDRVVCAEAA